MRVLKPDRQQQGWSKKVTCTGSGNGGGGCGAKLLVEQPDIYLTHRFDYGGGHDVYKTFSCGACGVETDLPDGTPLPFAPPDKKDWRPSPNRGEGGDRG